MYKLRRRAQAAIDHARAGRAQSQKLRGQTAQDRERRKAGRFGFDCEKQAAVLVPPVRESMSPRPVEREMLLPMCLFPELYWIARPGRDPDPFPNANALGPAVWSLLAAEGFDVSAPLVVSASQDPGTFSIFQRIVSEMG